MAEVDYIVVGSGINGLVCAALLALKGRKVMVLERNDRIGGCIRTEAITAPGFIHDVMATTFVLFITSPAYAALAPELERRGLAFAHAEVPTGVLRPDGRHLVLSRSRDANRAAFEQSATGDGAAFEREMAAFGTNAGLVFSVLGGQLWSRAMLQTVAKELWRRGPRGFAAFLGEALVSARAHLEGRYKSPLVRDLFAPWVLHTGLGPESAYSGEMIKVIGFALEAAGAPIVKGGAQNLLDAFGRLIRDKGGVITTGADVVRVDRDTKGQASGVTLGDGRSFAARQGVICSMSPERLYRGLLAGADLPVEITEGLGRYRYGKGNMQIHYALAHPPRWRGEGLDKVALLHLTPGLDGVSKAANEAERGILPAVPTICVGQPTALDPSRAPEGKAVLWLQLPEAPREIKGDAAGEIAPPADGRWTGAIREAYADRVEAVLARHIDGFKESILGRRAYSPADLETLNVNLVGGDPYGGYCGLDQFFLWRPFKGTVNHRTPVPRLYHIGAATHPGPGLGGGSGYLLAKSLP
ncbi:phytoene desaturase family protein [Lichenifustis flavocetrariae]|uniref:NAD(P)/FAD-dependent oxidoreductase n=1 Tax=Lichenifustis flavocetrariae TaxID=2949735 RepID=A0AA42CP17_9HYPH|nr:NAD(P)/FAD-dependent oxidoreductase [Lichenifustis flavocetrariae]MCW6509965.1 NAD(P)/FAD-dependent oxidoreductase [Lichenifustis flavocetrariae]